MIIIDYYAYAWHIVRMHTRGPYAQPAGRFGTDTPTAASGARGIATFKFKFGLRTRAACSLLQVSAVARIARSKRDVHASASNNVRSNLPDF